jgi:hypothetical protein
VIGGIVTSRGINNDDDDVPGAPDLPRVRYEIRDWAAVLLSKQAERNDCYPVAACVQSINQGESIKRCEISTRGLSDLSESLLKSVHPRSFTDSSPLAARHKHMPGFAGTYQPYGRVGEERQKTAKGRGAVVQMESCSYPFLVIGPRLATRW